MKNREQHRTILQKVQTQNHFRSCGCVKTREKSRVEYRRKHKIYDIGEDDGKKCVEERRWDINDIITDTPEIENILFTVQNRSYFSRGIDT